MEIIILSKFKIDAVEHNLTEFLAEEIVDAIEERTSLVITDAAHIESIRKEYPDHKHEYVISVRKLK